jgi:hypothetical protein
LNVFNLSSLLLDDPLHLLAQLVLEVNLLLFELLLDLSRPALMLFHGLLAVHLSLVYTVMHTLDLSLSLGDGGLMPFDLLAKLRDSDLELLNLSLEVGLSSLMFIL